MMVATFGALSEKVKNDTGRMERWLTGEEVCGQLRISRVNRRLIGYKPQLKPEEVKRLIPLIGTLYPRQMI